MRQTRTTYRRLLTGAWKQSMQLTAPYPRAVRELYEQFIPGDCAGPELAGPDQSSLLPKACLHTSDSNDQP